MWPVQSVTVFSSNVEILEKPSAVMTQLNSTHIGKKQSQWREPKPPGLLSKVTRCCQEHLKFQGEKHRPILRIMIPDNHYWPIYWVPSYHVVAHLVRKTIPGSRYHMPIYGWKCWDIECLKNNPPGFYHSLETVKRPPGSGNFLKFKLGVSVCVFIYANVSVWPSWGPEKGCRSPGFGVTGGSIFIRWMYDLKWLR